MPFDPSKPFEVIKSPKKAGFDPSLPFEVIEEPLGQRVLGGVVTGAKALGSVTGDPTRAAISAAQTGGSPVGAYVEQFANMDKEAPSGAQIARQAGVPDRKFTPAEKTFISSALRKASPILFAGSKMLPQSIQDKISNATLADVAGGVVDLAADPLVFMSPALKGVSAGAKAGENLIRSLPKGAESLDFIGRAAKKIPTVTGTTAKTIEAFTGIPAKPVERFMTDRRGSMAAMEAGGGDIQEAADVMRNDFMGYIKKAKTVYAKKVENLVDKAVAKDPTPKIDINEIIDTLEAHRDKLIPQHDMGAIAEINQIIDNVKSGAIPGQLRPLIPPSKKAIQSGQLPLGRAPELVNEYYLNSTKKYLQAEADSAYMKPGQIFLNKPLSQQAAVAAQHAASVARRSLNKAVPGVEEANNQLHLLHIQENVMNRNILAEGKPAASLIAAGSENSRNRKVLSKINEVVQDSVNPEIDMVADAERLAAGSYFYKPQILPVDSTGKSAARMGLGAGVGYLAAELLSLPHKTASVVASMFASPLVVKAAIDTGRLPVQLVKSLGVGVKRIEDLTPAQYASVVALSQTAAGAKIIGDFYRNQDQQNKDLLEKDGKTSPIIRRMQQKAKEQ